MRLKQKIALVMAAAILLMVGLNAAVLLPVADGFQSIEDDEAARNGDRVRQAIQVRLDAMVRSAMDWSHWDESYRFVAGLEEDFVDENLTLESFATLGVNLIYFYDLDGNIVWGRTYDLDTGEEIALPRFAPGSLAADDMLLSGRERSSSERGIVVTAAGPMLVVSTAIMPTSDTGPARGTFVIGRFLDAATADTIKDEVLVEFEVTLADAAAAPPSDGFAIAERKPDILVGTQTLADIYGAPAIVLRSQTPRDVTRVGDSTISLAMIALAAVGLVDIVVMGVLLQRLVLRPVSRMTDHVLEVHRTGKLDKRVPAAGTDEFGVLGAEFNRMLDRVAETREQLVKRTNEAEAARRVAEHANEAKTTFLTNMSHELRTPLNAILGFSELMLHGAHGPMGHPKYKEYLGDINASGKHLLSLISTILNLAQASNGSLTLDEREVPIDAVIDAALRLVRPQAIASSITLQRDDAGALPAVYGDNTKLTQVLTNILSNAVKFTPEGGRIEIAAEMRDDGGLEIRVTDTGIGMRPEDIPEVLKPFVQVNDDHGSVGTGLGLPLAVALVELHDGRLSIESALGRGTTVAVWLPAERIRPVEAEASRRSRA